MRGISNQPSVRQNVYYEAGFAQGLGIPVIWLCNNSWETFFLEQIEAESKDAPSAFKRKKWSERLHFDTRQFPHILWKDAGDLKKQLVDKIQALGLDEPAGEGTA